MGLKSATPNRSSDNLRSHRVRFRVRTCALGLQLAEAMDRNVLGLQFQIRILMADVIEEITLYTLESEFDEAEYFGRVHVGGSSSLEAL